MSTITEVAKEARVATSTVSLVYNSPDRVKAATRKKVEEASIRLGYRPKSVRQAPKMHLAVAYSRAMTVKGSMVEYCRQWIAGIRESLDAQGVDMSVLPVEGNAADDPMFLRSMDEGDFAGLLSLGIYSKHGHVEAAVARNVPAVCVNRVSKTAQFSTVMVDYRQSGALAARRLASAGHRKVGLGFSSARPEVAVLCDSYKDAIVAAGGLEPLALPFVEGFDDLAGFRRMAKFVLDEGITGCFLGDPSALRLSEALAAEGVDVPDRVSLIGLDALQFRTPSGKRLTSIGYNAKVLGQTCAQLLQTIVASRGEIRHMTSTIGVRLVEGETIGPAVS